MNISAIKTTIQNPLKRVFPLALGALTLVSCQSSIGRIKDYCWQFDKSAKDCTSYINSAGAASPSNKQAVLDSLVYRDLLNNSVLAKDSSAVAEFNKISTNSRYRSSLEGGNEVFDKFLVESNISTKDYQDIMNRNSPVNRQFYADKYLFKKFFTEKGLMTEDFAKNFEMVSKFLRPITLWEAGEIAHIIKPSKE